MATDHPENKAGILAELARDPELFDFAPSADPDTTARRSRGGPRLAMSGAARTPRGHSRKPAGRSRGTEHGRVSFPTLGAS
jgi:hypothetical protein